MFPDIANLLTLREALWRRRGLGNASVMVGAGFSRNADPVGVAAGAMPTWTEMAQALCRPLYPSDPDRLDVAMREASGVSGFLRLAQEYRTAFGQSALYDRIRAMTPDAGYRPGDLHRRLLGLPWSDVFSTNWDTLLERARDDVFHRRYDVIRTSDEIAYSRRPRIVKLHGSFPAHHPLIFTEDDYRAYPRSHAPFVNLVQQSMMETLFCLIGFSGDDPNFLHWSGWVRDNLGDAAPMIYLAGWLDISPHRRRMLEARNVMPIDLSALPAAVDWPRAQRHRYATEWFIAALEHGAPYDPLLWPFGGLPDLPTAAALLGPIPQRIEPYRPRRWATALDANARANSLRALIAIWRDNRMSYPGWLIAPHDIRSAVWQNLDPLIPEFKGLDELTPIERIQGYGELFWLLELCLFPPPRDIERAALSALEAMSEADRSVDQVHIGDTDLWEELLRWRDSILLASARNARHSGERDAFFATLSRLEQRAAHDVGLRNAVDYEKCLWDRGTGDFAGLIGRLQAWTGVAGSPPWLMRKAGLLAELGDDTRACGLLEEALADLRRGATTGDDIAARSVEGWAMYFSQAYDPAFAAGEIAMADAIPDVYDRWRELARLNCDPRQDYAQLSEDLAKTAPAASGLTERRGFDLHHVAVSYRIVQPRPKAIVDAYAMLLMSEITGVPPMARRMNLFHEGLKRAASILAASEPVVVIDWASRLHLSAAELDTLITRRWVAELPQAIVPTIFAALLRAVAFLIPRLEADDRHDDADHLTTSVEVLSRIAVRLSDDNVDQILTLAMTLNRSPAVGVRPRVLRPPLDNLVRRSLEALPADALTARLPSLFTAPLPPVDEDGSARGHDPALLIPDWFRAPSAGDTSEWRLIVARLIDAAGQPDTRRPAINRLQTLYNWGYLTPSEVEGYAQNLWRNDQLNDDGLPGDTEFMAWVAARMPSPDPDRTRQLLESKLDRALGRPTGDSGILPAVAELAIPLSQHYEDLNLGGSRAEALTAHIMAWAIAPVPDDHPISRIFSRMSHSDENDAAEKLLLLATPSAALIDAVTTKIAALEGRDDPALLPFKLYSGLAYLAPEIADELAHRLRRALAAGDRRSARYVVDGLHRWLFNSGHGARPHDIDGAVADLARSVAAGNPAIVTSGLSLMGWLISHGPEDIRPALIADLDVGLQLLNTTAAYSHAEAEFDVPGVRALCVRLALALDRAGHGSGEGVQMWLLNAVQDPLPEVRNADRRVPVSAEGRVQSPDKNAVVTTDIP